MPIGDLSSKISSDAASAVNNKNNPPDFEPGFEDDDGDFDNLFDDIDIGGFGGSSETDGGSTGSTFGGASTFGGGNTFGGDNTFGGNSVGGAFGGLNQMQQPVQPAQPKKPDTFDVMWSAAGTSSISLGKVMLNILTSVKSRNADDIGMFSKNMLMCGIGIAIVSVISLLIGLSGDFNSLKALSGNLLVSSLLCFGTGLVGLGSAAIRIITQGEYKSPSMQDIPEINNSIASSEDEGLDDADNFDSIFGDLFGDEDGDEEPEEPDFDDFKFDTENKVDEAVVEPINYNKLAESAVENVPLLNRDTLFNIFKGYFPLNTPGFSIKEELDPDGDEFHNLEILATQALAAAARVDIADIKSRLIKATSTFFCYELCMDRIKGVNRLEDIEREMAAYFRDKPEDLGVTSKVDIVRDSYRIIVTKGAKAIVTFGDCFQITEVCDHMKNTKNRLPFIAGIDDFGNPILTDAKIYTAILIAGKQRSGKSWYVDSIIIPLMTFNTPEDIAFLIIDPKESNLFKTIALMPHVCGLHNDEHIIQIMDDLINKEGARRKKILADNRCDDIWDLRERKHIKIPVLYLIIDEVMTVINNLDGGRDKEFFKLLNVIITQLPSQGICVLFVPHRAQGVVDKTSRTLMSFVAAVKADAEVVKETLDIKKWDRFLTEPGDTALRISDTAGAKFVKGVALTTTDGENNELIQSIAKTFYKMGVDIPDMESVGCGYNRDEEHIRQELELNDDSKHVQYNLDSIGEDLDTLINEVKLDD